LLSDAPETAVAIGAAIYAGLRHDASRAAELIVAESARSYYIGVQGSSEAGHIRTVCVMPRGVQEGTQYVLDRPFTVVSNQPATFTLLSSIERNDALGEMVTFADGEGHRHAPLVTALRYGQRSRRVPIAVTLRAVFTEVGTLELWCQAQATE